MRGRPAKSKIRRKIAAILQHANTSYGYEIYKNYKQVFGPVKMRTVYYNLRKGVMLNEFLIQDIKREIGNYTWGNEVERIYYTNGPYSEPILLDETQKIKLNKIEQKNQEINKEEIIKTLLEEIKDDINEYANNFKTYTVNSRTKKYETINNKLKKLKNWNKQKTNKTEIEIIEKQLKNYEY
jgi:hypothetical protein